MVSQGIDGYLPIEDYAIIGDGMTGALVSRGGSIDWACFPRFDSPSVFARILDARKGGSWAVRPAGEFSSFRRYLPDTAVLETTFDTVNGRAVVIDFMPAGGEGQGRAPSTIMRTVRGVHGEVEFVSRYEPAFDYARRQPVWEKREDTAVRAIDGEALLMLEGTVGHEVEGGHAHATFRVARGDEVSFVLGYEEGTGRGARENVAGDVAQAREATVAWWLEWMAPVTYRGPHEALVRRSVLTLKLLDYFPTGAIVAAFTTSLPEEIGGVRNWDYRYAWLRDVAFTLYAFYVTGHPEESEIFLRWVMEMAHDGPASLQVMYGLEGERDLAEEELPHLEGYMGSTPVRIGNKAHEQLQLDIFGEVMDSAYLFQKRGGTIAPGLWEFLVQIVDFVCENWTTPDQGIWEVRSEPQHFVYSKVLCWVAVDRGIKIAEWHGYPADLVRWKSLAAEIREEVLANGYDAGRGAFMQAYGSDQLDAAILSLPLRRFIEWDDPRMVSTVDVIADQLSRDGLLKRYSSNAEDGLPGYEGAFMLCNFWLVDCYANMGRLTEAEMLFNRLIAYGNDVGLFAEEIDPQTGHQLGNFPQAFTHVALINAANSLAEARIRGARRD